MFMKIDKKTQIINPITSFFPKIQAFRSRKADKPEIVKNRNMVLLAFVLKGDLFRLTVSYNHNFVFEFFVSNRNSTQVMFFCI